MHAAVKTRWSRLNDFELEAVAGNDYLVNQVAIKYGVELSGARTEVEELLRGLKWH